MRKIPAKYFLPILLLILSLAVYESTVSNGLYINDDAALASAIDSGTVTQTYIYQSSPLYVEISLLLHNISQMSPEITLSQVSIISMALSVVPFFLILRKYFDERLAVCGSLLYIFLPFVWFNAINAKTYAVSILLSNIFIYFLLFSKKTKLNLVFLSVIFGIISVIHTMNLFLLPLFLVYMDKNYKRVTAIVISAVCFLGIRFASKVSLFSQYGYIAGNATLKTIIFGLGLNLWALFNAFGIFTFALVIFGIYMFAKYNKDKKMLLWTLPAVSLLIYGKESISGMTPVIPFMILCGVYLLSRIKNQRKVLLIVALCLVFQVIKFLPFALMIHQFVSPHQLYAETLLNITTKNDVILGGHEGAWLFGKRTFYTPSDNFTIDQNKTYFMTMHFITTENRIELQSLADQIGKLGINISSITNLEIQNNSHLLQNRCECQNVSRGTNFEDPYLYFTAVSPSIVNRLIFVGNPAYNVEYWVCKLCFLSS